MFYSTWMYEQESQNKMFLSIYLFRLSLFITIYISMLLKYTVLYLAWRAPIGIYNNSHKISRNNFIHTLCKYNVSL